MSYHFILQFSYTYDDEPKHDMSLFGTEREAYDAIRKHVASNITNTMSGADVTEMGELLMQEPTDEVMMKIIDLWALNEDETFKVHYAQQEFVTHMDSKILVRHGFKDLLSEFPHAEVPDEVVEIFRTQGFTAARAQMKQIADQWETEETAEDEARHQELLRRIEARTA